MRHPFAEKCSLITSDAYHRDLPLSKTTTWKPHLSARKPNASARGVCIDDGHDETMRSMKGSMDHDTCGKTHCSTTVGRGRPNHGVNVVYGPEWLTCLIMCTKSYPNTCPPQRAKRQVSKPWQGTVNTLWTRYCVKLNGKFSVKSPPPHQQPKQCTTK